MFNILPIVKTLFRRKLGVLLLVIQVAIAAAIFSNLAYIIKQMKQDMELPSGFEENQLFSVTLRPLAPTTYADVQRDLNSLYQQNGLEQASFMRRNPLGSSWGSGRAFLRASQDPEAKPIVAFKARVSDTSLRTLNLKLESGRDFFPEDMAIEREPGGEGPNSIVVSHALAEALFGEGENYIGRVIYEGNNAREIIGVTEDTQGFTREEEGTGERTAYYPQFIESESEIRYMIRAKSREARVELIEKASQLLRQNYQNQVFLYVEKVDDIKNREDHNDRVFIYLLWVLIVVLGFTVAFAISGQTLFHVNQRTKQVGIRRALGASRRAIIWEFIAENGLICCIGLALGTVLTIQANQLVIRALRAEAMPLSYMIGTWVVLLVICVGSAMAPAWRASKISPSIATRTV